VLRHKRLFAPLFDGAPDVPQLREFEIFDCLLSMNLSTKTGIALLLSLIAVQAAATDIAILRNGFTIRHESRAPLGESTRLFLTPDGASFVDVPTAEIVQIERDLTPPLAPPAAPETVATAPVLTAAPATPMQANSSPVDVTQVVTDVSGRYRLDPDLVNSVIRAESGFKVHAVSPKGAQGLMQLMPGTALKLGVPNAFDPEANVDGGTRYLRELLERYNFDLIKALAAYNAGPHRVEQYGGVPPYRETRKYVASIVRDFNRKKLAQQKAAKTAPLKGQAKVAATAKKPAPATGN
jgi:soluble lytic murein transglycosylase-like protein